MNELQGGTAMKTKALSIICLGLLVLAGLSCYRPYGSRFYPDVPRFAPTDPGQVALMRREPRRDHIRLGEVWIRPSPSMDRFYVEGLLRDQAARMGAEAVVIVVDRFFREGVAYSYWRGPVPVYERQIVGIAIRYHRPDSGFTSPAISARPPGSKLPRVG
jgi:hypothetical protein